MPGQSIQLRVGNEWREYSIARQVSSEVLELIIKLVHGGKGSAYFSLLQEGDSVEGFIKTNSTPKIADNKMIFVSTGTGIVPLFAIVHSLLEKGYLSDIIFISSFSDASDMLYLQELNDLSSQYKNFEYKSFANLNNDRSSVLDGRGIDYVLENIKDYRGYGFYICARTEVALDIKLKLLDHRIDESVVSII